MKVFPIKKRRSGAGNTIAEYALPIALVVVASGVIATNADIQAAIPQFFASASGASVSGSNIVAKSMGDNQYTANSDGSGGFDTSLNGNTGQTGAGLALAGQATPQIEVSGGMGTNKALAYLNEHPIDMTADADEGDYEASSTYVAMVKDLAITTQMADEAASHAGTGGKTKQNVLDEYASAVAAKKNAINQFAFSHVVQVIKHGGVGGLNQVDNHADTSQDQFEAGDDSQADYHGEQEEEAVTTDEDTSAATQADADSATQNSFLWTLNMYDNVQYQPIDTAVFEAWRKNTLEPQYGASFPIWALDYEGNVDVLKESWGAFLDQIE